MNVTAVAVHAALLLLAPVVGFAALRSEPSRLVWPVAGLAAVACASASTAGSPARAILGIAVALCAGGVAGGGLPIASVVAAGAFVSLAAGLALGMDRYAGYLLYAVATALLVLAAAAGRLRSLRAAERLVVVTAAVAVGAPLLDLAGRWAFRAPWATLPHALAIIGVVALRQPARADDQALAGRLQRLERELGFARHAGAVAIVAAAAVHELKGLLGDLRLAAQYGIANADPGVKDRALSLIDETLSEGRGRVERLLEDLHRDQREATATFAVREALDAAARSLRDAAPAGALRIAVECPPGLALTARRGELELALACLARNALAAGTRRGAAEVTLRGAAVGAEAEIEVVDAAGGLPLDLRAGVFEPSGAPREGLGLLLAARLVEQNGGRLEYLSSEGRRCFRIGMPARVDSGAEPLL